MTTGRGLRPLGSPTVGSESSGCLSHSSPAWTKQAVVETVRSSAPPGSHQAAVPRHALRPGGGSPLRAPHAPPLPFPFHPV